MDNSPSDLLVDAEWLKEHLNDPNLRILDARTSDPRLPIGYSVGHIPGAIALNPGRDFFLFENGAPKLIEPEKLVQLFAQRGISNDATVVIYDESTGQLAAITYWVLRYVGHREVKVLHGGWAAWESTRGAGADALSKFPPAQYAARIDAGTRATAEWIQANASRHDVLLLDVRTEDEYATGHIPGAVNVPFDVNLDWQTQTFKDAGTLRAQFESVGATPNKEIVVYCEIGARASHAFLALSVAGFPRVRNYDGSIVDWYYRGRLPVE